MMKIVIHIYICNEYQKIQNKTRANKTEAMENLETSESQSFSNIVIYFHIWVFH